MIERVGYHVGDGLALSSSRRTIKNEAASFARLHNGFHLRRVDVNRNGKCTGFDVQVDFAGISGFVVASIAYPMLLQQTFDDGRAAHLLGVVVDVVPHHELVEREQTEQRLFNDIPFGMVHQMAANDGKHFLHIDAVLVFRKGRETCQVHVVLLFQHLHQGGVERDVLIACADDIVVATTTDNVNRHQQKRGKTWAHALVVLKPLQQSQYEEQ